jgi:pseudouridine-5'-phosphate glycosidase
VIAHGLPYPANLETARGIEEAVRRSGAVPATIGIADGAIQVGMGADMLERFSTEKGIGKVSSRDMGMTLASGGLGATTVASSIIAASLAGITVFSTAGVGGVHRGFGESFDVSADLVQFTRTKSIVVCAGAKTILDLGATLEYLETQCVPVVGFQCDDFPGFYCVSSGHANPARVDTLAELVDSARQHWALGNPGSVLLTSPIDDADAIDSEAIARTIATALDEAAAAGVRGPRVTPYVMKAVSAATEGRSSTANRAVLLQTAELAGSTAVAWASASESVV